MAPTAANPKDCPEYDPKNMIFRRLGPSGLRVSLFSLGGWLTYGGTVNGDETREIIKLAFENGVAYQPSTCPGSPISSEDRISMAKLAHQVAREQGTTQGLRHPEMAANHNIAGYLIERQEASADSNIDVDEDSSVEVTNVTRRTPGCYDLG